MFSLKKKFDNRKVMIFFPMAWVGKVFPLLLFILPMAAPLSLHYLLRFNCHNQRWIDPFRSERNFWEEKSSTYYNCLSRTEKYSIIKFKQLKSYNYYIFSTRFVFKKYIFLWNDTLSRWFQLAKPKILLYFPRLINAVKTIKTKLYGLLNLGTEIILPFSCIEKPFNVDALTLNLWAIKWPKNH